MTDLVELPMEVDLLHRLAVGQEAQTRAITSLIQAVLALPAPVVELPASPGGQLDTAALGVIMREAVLAGIGPLVTGTDQMAAAIQALAQRPETPQPTVIRGGSLSKVSLIDLNGNQIGTPALPISVTQAALPNLVGTWHYHAGVSGNLVVPAGERVIGITAHATTAGTMAINGGDSVPIPANTAPVFTPNGQLVAPSITFTGTDSFVVETLS